MRAVVGIRYRRRPVTYCLAATLCLIGGMIAVAADSVSEGGAEAGFVDLWAALALIPVLLSMWTMQRMRYGSAVAWGCVALPPVAFSALLSVHFLHLSGVLGLVTCDAMADDCGVAPLVLWLPLVLFVASGALLAVSVGISKAMETTDNVP